MNDKIKTKINSRYEKEINSENMGCANLTTFYDFKPDSYILDLGCGNGNGTFRLRKSINESGFIYGLDLTEKMITKAKANNTFDNVDFIKGDIHSLPFNKNYFNAIISNCVINHSLNKKQVFSEIYRVLKPGGYFLIGDVMAVEELPESVHNDPKAIADCYGGAILKTKYINTVNQLGFKNVQELSSRQYYKNGFLLESIILKGVK